MSYNIVKARYSKTDENGKDKVVTEQYLVDALSCTEAEAKVIGELSPLYSDLQVKSIGDTRIAEVVNSECTDGFYTAKIAYVTLDERTGAEKRDITQWLIGGTDFNDAYEMLLRELNKCVSDIEIIGLAKSPIVEFLSGKS